MLLHVVGSCCAKFETGQATCKRTQQLSTPTTSNISFIPWSTKRSATMLDPFAQLFQHCWVLARASHIISLEFTKFYGLSPHDALQVPTLLWVVASICTPLPTRTEQLLTLLGVVTRSFSRIYLFPGAVGWKSVKEGQSCCFQRKPKLNKLNFRTSTRQLSAYT